MRLQTLLIIAAAAITSSLAAQTTPLADSAMVLDRAGLWEAAGQLVQASWTKTSSPDDHCALQVAILYSLDHTGQLDAAARQFKTFDQQCATNAAAQRYAAELDSVRVDTNLPPIANTGLDFSAIDAFWSIADTLASDVEPSEAAWHAMFATTGYRLSMREISTTRRDMEIELRPSNRAQLDSVRKLPDSNDRANRVRHIAQAFEDRAVLARYRDSVSRALPVQQAVALASRYLPPHATDGKEPPLVAFSIFRDDAYSLGPRQIIVDLEHVSVAGGLTTLLAHEFHHSYLAGLDRTNYAAGDTTNVGLVRALASARNEGIADLVDKPYPVHYDTPAMAAYAARYNAAYARTPQVIHSIDSALVVAADDSTQLPTVGRRVYQLLPSGGHYNGSYLAREIYETFGVDSLFPGVKNPFAFWRAYGEAEVKHGRPWPFSSKAQALLDKLERKFVPPAA